MHTIVFQRHRLLGTRFRVESLSAAIKTNWLLEQHTKQIRTYSNLSPETAVDRRATVRPRRHNDSQHAMNRFREVPFSTQEEWPQNQSPGGATPRSNQYPRAEHTPNTEQEEAHVYVLTLKVTERLSLSMNGLRERFFPKHLNRTPAHLTLFHALPHSRFDVLDETLTQTAANMDVFHVSAGRPFQMRRGVGINVGQGYSKTKEVHERLRSRWLVFLSEQDSGGFRPHWTAMNKVNDEEKVRSAFETIQKELLATRQAGRALGLALWNYNGGEWELAKEYMFGDARKSSQTPG